MLTSPVPDLKGSGNDPSTSIRPEEVTLALKNSSKGRLVYQRDPFQASNPDPEIGVENRGHRDVHPPSSPEIMLKTESKNHKKVFFEAKIEMDQNQGQNLDLKAKKKAEFVENSLWILEISRKAKLQVSMDEKRLRIRRHLEFLRKKADFEIEERLQKLTLDRKNQEEDLAKQILESRIIQDQEIEENLQAEIRLQNQRKEMLERSVEKAKKTKALKQIHLNVVEDNLKMLDEVKISSVVPSLGLTADKLEALANVDMSAVMRAKDALAAAELAQDVEQMVKVMENHVNAIRDACQIMKKAGDEARARLEEQEAEAVRLRRVQEKEEQEAKAKEEEAKAARVQEQAALALKAAEEAQKAVAAEEAQPAAVVAKPELQSSISAKNSQKYEGLKAFKGQVKAKVKPLVDDKSQFRFLCQKAVNTPVNAISPISSAHLADKLQKLAKLLRGDQVEVSGQQISASSHPLGVEYSMLLLAKKFVCQGEDVISSKPETAFSMAAVIVSLWDEFPVFGQLFLARLFEVCPYLIPYLPPQPPHCTKEQYQALGYKYDDEGKIEEQTKFIKRMTGMARLYAAITISNLPKDRAGRPHPHGLGNIWSWLSSSMNMKPINDVTATLIFDILEVAGFDMFNRYKGEFRKLLRLLMDNYFPLIREVTLEGCGGPVMRLETFLQKAIASGTIRQPSAVLKPGFL